MNGTYASWRNRNYRRAFDNAQSFRIKHAAALPLEPSLAQLTAELLHEVLEDRRRKGERAAGPDGVRLSTLSRSDGWEICRQLARLIKAGKFQPSTAREIRLKKPDGGYRTINIRSLAFGLVAGAVHVILQPKLESIYLPTSSGFRPRKDRWHLLLALERQAVSQGHWVLTQNDIRKAFDFIPVPQAKEVFKQHYQDKRLLKLISTLLEGQPNEHRETGIDQGSPISGDALNLLAHVHLDVPLHRDGYQLPVYRFVDNVAVGTSGMTEGLARMGQVAELLLPLGMHLKYETRPVDLREEAAELLGFEISHHEGQIRYSIPETSWSELHEELDKARETKNPGQTAENLIRGWIEAHNAAFENRMNVQTDRIHMALLDTGHREIPMKTIQRQVQASTDRWKAFREREMTGGQ